jgi:hypothetical protein
MRPGHEVGLAILLVLASTHAVLACSCARNPTASALLESSAAVFTGIAQSSASAGQGASVTTFRVTEAFKGVRAGHIVRVRHRSGSSASCGVNFARGEAHTLAVSSGRWGYSATLCSAWMFLPQVGLGADLIEQMRALRR